MTTITYASVDRLCGRDGVTALSDQTVDAFVAEGTTALLFIGSGKRYPEVDDVAIVVPELMREFAGRFRVGVLDADTDTAAAQRFDVAIRPTLVFVRDGVRIGAIPRIRDWSVYLAEISAILATPPVPPLAAPAHADNRGAI